MLIKFISSATFLGSAIVFSANLKNPTDPLFFVISGGLVVCLLRLLFSAILVAATFIELPSARSFRIALALFGIPLIIVGAAGLLTNSFDFAWYGLLKPLDYLLIIETGLVMNILALEPQRQPAYTYDSLIPTHNRTLLISAFTLRTKKLKSAS